jgi:E3 ubiquitin-protein ligase DOA10
VGLDGGIELAGENHDVQTMKNKKTYSQKSNKGTKSENNQPGLIQKNLEVASRKSSDTA